MNEGVLARIRAAVPVIHASDWASQPSIRRESSGGFGVRIHIARGKDKRVDQPKLPCSVKGTGTNLIGQPLIFRGNDALGE
jgi:hypothetical protein